MNIIEKISSLFKRNPMPRGRVYFMRDHHGWGNAMHWTRWPELRVHGHLYRIPEVGDVIVADFVSSRSLEFQVTNVERCRDPSDMFFANVKYLGIHSHEEDKS